MATEKDRLLQQLTKYERMIGGAFMLFVSTVQSEEVFGQVADLLELGDIEGALAIVDQYVLRMAPVLARVFTEVGVVEATALAAGMGAAGIGLAFNAGDTRAANLMRLNQLQFVTGFTEEQRQATRQALVAAFEVGAGRVQAASHFKDSIGLTAAQEQAVTTYRQQLEAGSTRALDRALRDRRFDRSVASASANNAPLAPEQIDHMVQRYRERQVQYRAQTIARTEALHVTSMARDEALRQNIEAAEMEVQRVKRIWNVTHDGRQRDIHNSMQGQAVGLDERFTDGAGNQLRYPGDSAAPPETTVNCRCVVTVAFDG